MGRCGLALKGVITVADASPLHYLILIGHIDLLPALFSRILAATLLPAVVLIDERDGRREARRRGWQVMGTLGLLRAATDRQVEGLNLAEALARLRGTNFRGSDAVFAEVIRDA